MLNTYEQRQQNKKNGLLSRAGSVRTESTTLYDTGMTALRQIPFGQPILVGHHSERGDRAYRGRAIGKIDKSFQLMHEADELERRAEAVGTGGVSSDDPDAIAKLTEQLTKLQSRHETMVQMNKNARLEKKESPCPTWMLSNSNANIRRIEKRIDELKTKESMTLRPDVVTDLYTMRENRDDNRIQFIFAGKPEEEIRSILRRNAFKWSPTRSAWVRQLTLGGRRGADNVMSAIAEVI
jgi:hypothetical protein